MVVPGVTQGAKPSASRGQLTLQFRANRAQLFKAFQALANLADKSQGGKLTVRIDALFEPSHAGGDGEELSEETEAQ